MGSTRCPGKVLREAGGKPLLGWLLDRLEHGRRPGMAGVVPEVQGRPAGQGISRLVVATSAHASDDPIAAYCTSRGTPFFRGPLEDVTLRLLKASRGHVSFVRVCADSPLLRADTVDRAVEHFDSDTDVVTNSPAGGNSVEVIRRKSLQAAYPHMSAEEREHVTLYFYRNPEKFRIKRFRSRRSVLVDTEEDWEAFCASFSES